MGGVVADGGQVSVACLGSMALWRPFPLLCKGFRRPRWLTRSRWPILGRACWPRRALRGVRG
jgi:hypothetical protein